MKPGVGSGPCVPPPDIFPPHDLCAISQRLDESKKGDSIPYERPPGVSPFHRISYTAVPPVALGANSREVSSHRGDVLRKTKYLAMIQQVVLTRLALPIPNKTAP